MGAERPSKPRRLVLLRHGRTAWNESGRAQGHADVPLDDEGRAQAEAAAPYLAALELAMIWSSDLVRAQETAEIVGRVAGLPVKTDARLREYDVGEFQGRTFSEMRGLYPHLLSEWEAGEPGMPGAETYDDVAGRIVPACREALASMNVGETGLIVTHGASLRVAVAGLLGWAPEQARSLRGMHNCQVATLEEQSRDGRVRLRSYGATPISRT